MPAEELPTSRPGRWVARSEVGMWVASGRRSHYLLLEEQIRNRMALTSDANSLLFPCSGGNNSLLGRREFPARGKKIPVHGTGIRFVTRGNTRLIWRDTKAVSPIFPVSRELPRLGYRVEIVEEGGDAG